MTKKITAILLSFIMVLTFMPTMAFANPAPTPGTIGPVDFTTMADATANANYSWTPSADAVNVLVLNGGTIDGTLSSDATFTIKVPDATEIIISGDSKIIAPISDTSSNAILAEGSLNIKGKTENKKLTVDVSAGASGGTASEDAYGIKCEGSLEIMDLAELKVTAGVSGDNATSTAISTKTLDYDDGSETWYNVVINNSKLVLGAKEAGEESSAIDAGDLEITNSTITATAGDASISTGINSIGSATIESSNVTATAGKASFESIGIVAGDGAVIDGSTVTATGANVENSSVISGDADLVSVGMHSYSLIKGTNGCNITAKAGDISANSPSSDFEGEAYSIGVFADKFQLNGGSITANGKKVKVSSADAYKRSHGIFTWDSIIVNNGSLTAETTEKLANACHSIQSNNIEILDGTTSTKVATADAYAINANIQLKIGSSSKKAFLENAKMAVLSSDPTIIKSWNTITESTGIIEGKLIKPSTISSPVKITFNGSSQNGPSVEPGIGDTGSTGGEITGDALTMTYGQVYYIKATGTGLKYESDKTSVVTVGQTDGKVTAVGAGSANITITDDEGKKTVIKVTVNPKALTSAMLSDIADQDYTGADVNPAVVVKDGTKVLVKDTDYTLTYSNNKAIASKSSSKAPTATITGKGNYSGTVKKTFNILYKVTIADTVIGKAPVVTIMDGTKTLVNGTDYTVTFADTGKIGYATATITGKGIYAGLNKTVKFKIIPKKSTIKKLTVGKKKVTVAWNKTSGVDGYWIRIAKNKSFTSGLKKIQVKNSKTAKKVIKSLKTGKKYYVKVRAYKKVANGNKIETFYANWSTVKRTAKIK